MDVLLATRAFAPEPAAAAWRQRALAAALAGDGHRVDVLTTRLPRAARGAPEVAPPGVRVRRWPALRDATGNVRGYVQYASFDVPLVLRLVTRLARRAPRRGTARAGRGADVVVVEPPPTTGAAVRLVCALRRVPYAYYAADLVSLAAAESGAPAAVVRAVRGLESWVLRGAAVVLTVDDGYAERVRALGVAAERVVVVGTGVDTDRLRPVPQGEDGTPPDAGGTDHPAFVYAGTMSEVQGAGVLVDALAEVLPEHPGTQAVFYGGGVEAAALAERAERLAPGLVDFPGLVSLDVIARATSTARAGLASQRPDSAYAFAFLVKPLAATACGAPVVYAGAGPVADLVREHRLGWAVEHSSAAVADALRAALRGPGPSPAERSRLAAWTDEPHSLRAVAARAAAAVEAVAARAGRVR